MFRVKKRRRGAAIVDTGHRGLSFWHKLTRYVGRSLGRQRIYLIGDTHFDHTNIIKYCHRPFKRTQEMNETLVANWNKIVAPRDTVYFLGDWGFGRGHKPATYWRRRLRGHIVSIKGSHDGREKGIRFKDYKVIKYHGYSFLLIHNPNPDDPRQTENQKRKLKNWHGWIIHGHKHNNNMRNYPFINGRWKTINVAVELINYKPVSLDYLVSLGLDSIKRMDTVDSKPERK